MLPKPYFQDAAVTIYHGDCRQIVPFLPRFDLLLTDPPYGIGASSGVGKFGRLQRPRAAVRLDRARGEILRSRRAPDGAGSLKPRSRLNKPNLSP